MTKKYIKKLANLSFDKNYLNIKKVNMISKVLTRSELRDYIRFIKQIEGKIKIIAIVANLSQKGLLEKNLKKLFQGKKIEIREDKSMIAGIKIIDNDNIYDFNLKNTFDEMNKYLTH